MRKIRDFLRDSKQANQYNKRTNPADNSTSKKVSVPFSAEISIAIGMVNQTLVLRINSDKYQNGKIATFKKP